MLAVQAELGRLAEWRLSDLERQASDLRDQRRGLLRFLDGELAFSGLFAATMMRRLHGLEESGAALNGEAEAQASRNLEERGRLRQVERMVDALECDARRVDDAQQLVEAIEIALNRLA
jgi:hypothetical protein